MKDNNIENQIDSYKEEHKKKRNWHAATAFFSVLVAFSVVYSLMMPALTQTTEVFCGMQEHVAHTEECYEEVRTLICPQMEEAHIHTEGCYEEQPVLTCEKMEDDTHAHSDECYTIQKVLVCDKEEGVAHQHSESCYTVEHTLKCNLPIHQHALQCYSNPNADLESATIWEATFANVALTGDGAQDVLAIAQTQMGYQESERNYQVLRDGTTKNGYSRYGAWYGDAYGDWCAMFASFCIRYANIQDYPVDSNCQNWIQSLIQKDVYRKQNAYSPKSGDLLFFDKNADGIADHVGFVKENTGTQLHTIEGNMDNRVQSLSYTLQDSSILGYGIMPTIESKEEPQALESYVDGLVLGTVTAYEPSVHGSNFMQLDPMQERTLTPLVIDPYVVEQNNDGQKTQLLYKRPTDTDWTVFQNGSSLPGDASLRIEVVYENVNIDALLNAGRQLSYTVPDYMKDVVAQGNITADQEIVGKIDVQGNTAILTFDQAFLDTQKANGKILLEGTFYIESKLDLHKVEQNNPGSLVIGGVNIDINFEGDMIAKYGSITLKKNVESKVIEVGDKSYLKYTLTVTAGEYGCKEVTIFDAFQTTNHIDEYVGVTGEKISLKNHAHVQETGAPAEKDGFIYLGVINKNETNHTATITPAGTTVQKPGNLVWEIGNMNPGEVRTLTYQVQLKPEYTGVQAKDPVTNTADAFSQTYYRDQDSATFTPSARLDERKSSSNPVKNKDGTYTITYEVWVKAYEDNTYTLDNVKICDKLNHIDNMTESKYLKYITFDQSSFKLKDKQGQVLHVKNPHTGKQNPEINADKHGFTYYVGNLSPGEEKTLTYNIIINPGFFTVSGNYAGVIRNRALLYLDDTRPDVQEKHIQAYNTVREMAKKQWNRKMVGQKVESDLSVPISGSVYDATTESIQSISKPESQFIVPAGSYEYTVIVNEAGDWNVGSASMNDSLGNQYMQFTGYVKVETFSITDQAPSGNDQEVNNALNQLTPSHVVWVKVDGNQKFNFTPTQVGLPERENYAIRMTYYAKPVRLDEVTQVIVANDFDLSGNVGYGDFWYKLTGIRVQGSVLVGNASSFKAEKKALYYDRAASTGNYDTGSIYWAIQLEGNDLPVGLQIRDTTPKGENQDHKGNELFTDSVVGFYKGTLAKDITDYDSYEQAILNLEKINDSAYTVDLSQGETKHELQFTLKERIPLMEKEKAYIIIRTRPEKIPSEKREVYYCENSLSHRFENSNWIEDNTARQYIYGSENILKELQEAFTWDGSQKTVLITGQGSGLAEQAIQNKPGTYVAWDIKVNYMGNLKGTYTITDHIPQGMELVYARIKWLGSSYPDRENVNHQYTPRKTNLGAGWEEHEITAGTDGCGERTTYYYTNGNDVCWDIADLIANNQKDNASVDFQVLCRVTDSDVLLGGTQKHFNNKVTLTNGSGKEIGMDNDGVQIGKTSLSKQGTYNPEVNGGRYPFEVKVNPLAEDLIVGVDTITLVDEMSSSLKLDVSSVKVKNTITSQELKPEEYTISTQGQTLKVTVPDNQALTITYEALVQAAPGESIKISNKAHWEGYTAGSNSEVVEEEFSYAAGGTVSTTETPYIRVLKLDQYDMHKKLQGAEFKISEMECQGGSFTEKPKGKVWEKCTTNSDGLVDVGKNPGKLMDWNTVYQIVETKAPDGYVLDSTPHYFVIARKENGIYPPQINQYKEAGAQIYYLGAKYEYQATNHKGNVTLTKKFDNAGNTANINGTYTFGLYKVTPNGEELIDTKALTISSGSTNTSVTFNNLELDQMYKIYEMDDNNKPIQDGSTAMIHGQLFEVNFSNNTIQFDINSYKDIYLEMTNKVHYTELPETGGKGVIPIYIAGASLLAFAFIQKKKGKK